MVPPSWKTEIEETVEKAAHSSAERQRAENEQYSTEVSAAIKSPADAYNAQHNKPERKDHTKRFIDVGSFFLLVGTVVFTGLSWWVFRDQLKEMQSSCRPSQHSRSPPAPGTIEAKCHGMDACAAADAKSHERDTPSEPQ
jgi:hypothetical protein